MTYIRIILGDIAAWLKRNLLFFQVVGFFLLIFVLYIFAMIFTDIAMGVLLIVAVLITVLGTGLWVYKYIKSVCLRAKLSDGDLYVNGESVLRAHNPTDGADFEYVGEYLGVYLATNEYTGFVVINSAYIGTDDHKTPIAYRPAEKE